jgi:hypothetical protein
MGFVYDWDRVGRNSASVRGTGVSERSMGRIWKAQADKVHGIWFYRGPNGVAKLFRFARKL